MRQWLARWAWIGRDAALWLACTGVLLAALWALVRFVPGP